MPVISTNTAANTALRYLNNNAAEQSSALAKLASGSRITKASDDAAGLAIGTQLQSDVTVLSQAATNASQASSILQTADGGLSSISDILQRMKALATAAASGNVTDAQRTADLNTEYQQLIKEIDGISSGTRYSGNSLLDGTAVPDWTAGVDFIVGTSSTDKITVTIPKTTSTSLAIGAGDITTAANAVTAMGALTTAINTVTGTRAAVGALESQFSFHSQSIATTTENTSAAASAIMDADVASEKSQLSSADVKTQASVAALAQANKMPQELLSLLQG